MISSFVWIWRAVFIYQSHLEYMSFARDSMWPSLKQSQMHFFHCHFNLYPIVCICDLFSMQQMVCFCRFLLYIWAGQLEYQAMLHLIACRLSVRLGSIMWAVDWNKNIKQINYVVNGNYFDKIQIICKKIAFYLKLLLHGANNDITRSWFRETNNDLILTKVNFMNWKYK